MKKSNFTTSCLAILALVLFLDTNVFAQISTTWKGGTPGRANDWNCPKNWSNHTVPNAFSDVIIPDVSTTTMASPIIKTGRVEVNSLFLYTNASLTLEESAQLVIFQKSSSLLPSNFHPKGRLFLLDESTEGSAAVSASNK